ncbi:MAG: hypothetical protein HF314_12145 [Ignavibacteria bacterium]|jgi:chromosome segregation ATPase|nr:hypothetical protein [Ignavibacteria bacterium]MCU7503822.1 hypothetical protein [Ignavibacteria bacterium]MCU7517164.1 hypothetical protein [Ignavibacteria bacterium]
MAKNIDEALELKRQELMDLDSDIKNLEYEAEKLKPTVQEYQAKKEKAAGLKKLRREKQKTLDSVLSFLKALDEHYLDSVFPLFAQNRPEGGQGAETHIN